MYQKTLPESYSRMMFKFSILKTETNTEYENSWYRRKGIYAFSQFFNCFSESATSIVPLDSVTLLEDELNKVETVNNQFLFQIPNPLSSDYQCLQ